jgi:GH15 family glucan-1,4-alpha-glucosidase
VGPDSTLRLTTDAPISYVLAETPFVLEEPANFVLGPDETLHDSVSNVARDALDRTLNHWREWVRRLALPFEWQSAVIRAAITLKLCMFEDTGAIVAAMTTSIPEARDTARNWDYRYCWLRDAFFVVRALNSLSDVETMERYLGYLHNVALVGDGSHLQPVYGVGLETRLVEREVGWLEGFAGHRPVRVGNQAYEHLQHDVYGNTILAAAQSFFDSRLRRPSGETDFERFERFGDRAYAVYRTPDAGMWELRSRSSVHTSSTVMCWAACDRLSRIAAHLGRDQRASFWRGRADEIRAAVDSEAWSASLGSYVESFGGDDVEAGLLLMVEIGFAAADDSRFRGTLAAVERRLRQGTHVFRYVRPDDFGAPKTAFNVCTFWYLDALARTGRRTEAREIFERMLACRNRLGLLSEDVDPATHELWGNYPQTYSLVGIINAAVRLSRHWEEVI